MIDSELAELRSPGLTPNLTRSRVSSPDPKGVEFMLSKLLCNPLAFCRFGDL